MTTNELYHYGILGQKWGVRRYQYQDGSLTPAGRRRYAGSVSGESENIKIKDYNSQQKKQDEQLYGKRAAKRIEKRIKDGESVISARHHEVVRKDHKNRAKNILSTIGVSAAAIGIPVAVTAFLKKKGITRINPASMTSHAVSIGQSFISNILSPH